MSLIASGCKEKTLPASLGKLKKEDTEIFNVKYHTAKQLRHFKYESVQILVALFTSTKFMAQVLYILFILDLRKFRSLHWKWCSLLIE